MATSFAESSNCPIHWITLSIPLQGLGYIASISSLKKVSLTNCKRVNDSGIKQLAFLTKLQSLNLLYCPDVSQAALDFLQLLPGLDSLTLYMCGQVRPSFFASQRVDLSLVSIV